MSDIKISYAENNFDKAKQQRAELDAFYYGHSKKTI